MSSARWMSRSTIATGNVVASPKDAGPFREAVVADPAGATFSVSQLTAALSRRHAAARAFGRARYDARP